MSSKDKSKESKERDTVTNRRESVGWSKGPSLEVIPAAAKHAPAWGAGHVFERVAVDGRTELAAASGEELRGGGVSTGWADPQTNNVTGDSRHCSTLARSKSRFLRRVPSPGYAINPELQLDPNLRAHGGWRGHLACQRDTPEYEIATRIISNAAQITAEIRHEPDCLDCNWRWRDRNSLLKLLLTGAEGILSEEDADNLCTLATACGQVLRDQETVVDVPAPCKVFGDTHGQLRSLLLLFGAFGFPHHGAGDVQAARCINTTAGSE